MDGVDFNNDSYSDIIIGDPSASYFGTSEIPGITYVLLGGEEFTSAPTVAPTEPVPTPAPTTVMGDNNSNSPSSSDDNMASGPSDSEMALFSAYNLYPDFLTLAGTLISAYAMDALI